MVRVTKVIAYIIFFVTLFVMAIGIMDGPPVLFALSCVSLMLTLGVLILADIAETVRARLPERPSGAAPLPTKPS